MIHVAISYCSCCLNFLTRRLSACGSRSVDEDIHDLILDDLHDLPPTTYCVYYESMQKSRSNLSRPIACQKVTGYQFTSRFSSNRGPTQVTWIPWYQFWPTSPRSTDVASQIDMWSSNENCLQTSSSGLCQMWQLPCSLGQFEVTYTVRTQRIRPRIPQAS